MNKSKLNFIIDALMMLCMMAMAGLGLLMKYVLIPGKERWDVYGRNVNLFWRGLDRHEWGTIHLTIGIILLGLIILHIILHWNMILNMYRKLISCPPARKLIAILFIIACIILIAFPLLIAPEIMERPGGGPHGRGANQIERGGHGR